MNDEEKQNGRLLLVTIYYNIINVYIPLTVQSAVTVHMQRREEE